MLLLRLAVLGLVLAPLACPALADEAPTGGEKHLLRYKFSPGEDVRWDVVHQNNVDSTVQGVRQTSEAYSRSAKIWKFSADSTPDKLKFTHFVEDVQMRQKVSGRAEVTYDSRRDKEPPAEYKPIQASIGVPLVEMTVDARGEVLERVDKRNGTGPAEGAQTMVMPLPEEAVAVGHTWSVPYETPITLTSGGAKKIKLRRDYKLTEVDKGLAKIEVHTQVLSPVNDPAIEAQLIREAADGVVRFDIERGRVVGQQLDLDKRVIAFSGPASSMHYVGRFTEELSTAPVETARKP
jgi:hypothetical protein